jgi:prepilin-type N-terminal cleavage/methylation domain-containing protein
VTKSPARLRREGGRWFREGFTLLELLLVLTILGMVVAMTAPRLAGVTAGGLSTATRMNMARLSDLITVDLQKDGKYPSGMVNIVLVDTFGTYHTPMVSDQNPDNDPEVLGHTMDLRHRPYVHYLSEAEAGELRALGVLHIYNYNSPHDRNVTVLPGSPQMQPVIAGVAVLMSGGGAAGVTEPIVADLAEADRGRADELFRILLGLGAETSLIADGLAFNAPTCPESGMKPINYVWQYYSLMLPRLAATESRLRQDDPLGLGSGTVVAYGVRGAKDGGQLSGAMRRGIDVYARQHPAFFSLMDAEGQTRPGGEMVGWGLDFNGDGNVH